MGETNPNVAAIIVIMNENTRRLHQILEHFPIVSDDATESQAPNKSKMFNKMTDRMNNSELINQVGSSILGHHKPEAVIHRFCDIPEVSKTNCVVGAHKVFDKMLKTTDEKNEMFDELEFIDNDDEAIKFKDFELISDVVSSDDTIDTIVTMTITGEIEDGFMATNLFNQEASTAIKSIYDQDERILTQSRLELMDERLVYVDIYTITYDVIANASKYDILGLMCTSIFDKSKSFDLGIIMNEFG